MERRGDERRDDVKDKRRVDRKEKSNTEGREGGGRDSTKSQSERK